MDKNIDYYMGLNYIIEVVEDKEEGGYAISCPELTGCVTCAEDIQQGIKMIEDAKKCWFTACIEDNIPIPEPARAEGYNGLFNLRIPKSLHKTLSECSLQEGVSLNQYCLYLLSRGAEAAVLAYNQ